MSKTFNYSLSLAWTGSMNTANAKEYDRSYAITHQNKADIPGSADPLFKGDKTKWNPEEMILASLSGCFMLWYLHLCSANGVVLKNYADSPSGVLEIDIDGIGKMKEATLKPNITLADPSQKELATNLIAKAHKQCYMANSVNFPLSIEPAIGLK